MTASETAVESRSWRFWAQVLLDVFLAVMATLFALGLYNEVLGDEETTALGLIVVILHGASLLARRHWPLGVLTVMLATASLYTLALGFPVYMLGPGVLVATYTAASKLEPRRSLPVLLAVELVMVILVFVGPSFPDYGSLSLFGLLIAAAWFLGDLARRWRTAALQHEARAAELAAAREELAKRAVSEERLRIARELHDVVAHSMTVVALQAGSGRIAARHDPDAAEAALETIEHSSREALADMRRLVGVLRESEEAETRPTPGLGDIQHLADEIGRAGVTVEVSMSGPLEEVPASLALAVYRIAQEALTNVVRHSGVNRARLSVDAGEDGLTLIVSNGRAPTPVDHIEGGGHGIPGMRERATLYGGSLAVGPRDDGGYQVSAHFPASAGPP